MFSPLDLFPLKVNATFPFADVNVGEVFSIGTERYKLLSRNACSVRLLQWFRIYDWALAAIGRKVVESSRKI